MSNLYRWATSSSEATPTAADAAEADTPNEDADTGNRRSERLASTRSAANLQLPSRSRYPSPQQRVRDLSSARSPRSPSSRQDDHFSFDNVMDADAIRALVQETCRASIAASTTAVTAMLPDAVRTTVRDQVRDVTSLTRKPELPAFDKANIEIWIRRVENAFIRAGITLIKDRFAFLESKIGIDTDPKITEYLFVSDPDENTWTAFVDHLKKRYGRTQRQRVQSLISGTEFDGLQPSAVCALMKEKAGKVTVDDLIKEHIYRRLPVELQRQFAQEYETMTSSQLSELADSFYDKDGRPLHSSTTTSVNTIGGGVSNAPSTPTLHQHYSSRPSAAPNSSSSSNGFTGVFNDDNNDVNAIRQRQAQKQRYNNNNNAGSNNGSRSSNNNNNNRSNNNNNNDRYASKSSPIGSNGLCHFHEKFGNDAIKCVSGCKRWSAHSAGKGQASRQ